MPRTPATSSSTQTPPSTAPSAPARTASSPPDGQGLCQYPDIPAVYRLVGPDARILAHVRLGRAATFEPRLCCCIVSVLREPQGGLSGDSEVSERRGPAV